MKPEEKEIIFHSSWSPAHTMRVVAPAQRNVSGRLHRFIVRVFTSTRRPSGS